MKNNIGVYNPQYTLDGSKPQAFNINVEDHLLKTFKVIIILEEKWLNNVFRKIIDGTHLIEKLLIASKESKKHWLFFNLKYCIVRLVPIQGK